MELDKTAPVVKGSIVLKTSDAQQLQALQKSYEAAPRKVAVYAQFTMQAGKPAVLEIMDEEGRSVRVESDAVCETARRMPLKEERIAAQLKKSGDTPFVFENISYQLDEYFLSGNSIRCVEVHWRSWRSSEKFCISSAVFLRRSSP